MAFGTQNEQMNDESVSDRPKVDFDELNKYVVETAQLENRETLVGYVSAIVDLGLQEQEDAENVFTGTDEDEAEAIAEKPLTYFKDGVDPVSKKPVRLKCWPQKPIESVAIAVDFPDIIVDKGQFFGDSKPLPLRIWMGGQFYIPNTGMVVGRPTPLKNNKSTGKWSFDKKHLFHKMAVACKLIKPDESFVKYEIDKLIGKSFQFEAQVFFKESKGKQYYTEYIKFVGGLGRGQAEAEIKSTPIVVEFDKKNSDEAISEIRAHIVNTIKKAKNFSGSMLEKQLLEAGRLGKDYVSKPAEEKESPQENTPAPKQEASKAVAKPKVAPKPVEDFDDSDSLPF